MTELRCNVPCSIYIEKQKYNISLFFSSNKSSNFLTNLRKIKIKHQILTVSNISQKYHETLKASVK